LVRKVVPSLRPGGVQLSVDKTQVVVAHGEVQRGPIEVDGSFPVIDE
jgi:hypothetical protein